MFIVVNLPVCRKKPLTSLWPVRCGMTSGKRGCTLKETPVSHAMSQSEPIDIKPPIINDKISPVPGSVALFGDGKLKFPNNFCNRGALRYSVILLVKMYHHTFSRKVYSVLRSQLRLHYCIYWMKQLMKGGYA